jgi:holo-[acyl-carrier protein] synthase
MSIIGIGTDLVATVRIETIWNRFGMNFARRILTEAELEKLSLNKNPIHFLAKRFAAKEAVAKALGTGFRPQGILLTEIGVMNDNLGRPYLEFSGRTKEIFDKLGVKTHISLSDERDHALAFVILEVSNLDI